MVARLADFNSRVGLALPPPEVQDINSGSTTVTGEPRLGSWTAGSIDSTPKPVVGPLSGLRQCSRSPAILGVIPAYIRQRCCILLTRHAAPAGCIYN